METEAKRNPQITGEAMLLKELVAELKTLNENLGQFRQFKNLGDQPHQSLLDAVPPQQPLQPYTRPQDGVVHETQNGKEISEAGKSGEPAQDHLQQQSPQEHEVNQDEAEAISGTRERSALDRPREGPLVRTREDPDPEEGTSRHMTFADMLLAEVKALGELHNGETSEADKSDASARTDPPRQGAAAEMLDLFPSAALLRAIRRCLEEAVGPCRCKEPPIFIGRTRVWLTSNDEPDPRKEVHHAFRDVVLVVPASSAAASGLMEITLHPAIDATTPIGPGRGPGQLEGSIACRNFIRTSWPRHPVEPNDLRPRRLIARNDIGPGSSTLSSLVSSVPERGDYWFFIGASHDCIRKVQFYGGPSQHESLLTVPCLVYADCMRKVPRVISRDMDRGECHPDMARPRGPEDVQIGQVWIVTWHASVLNIESAAYILCMRVRQIFWEPGSDFDVLDFARHCEFFAAFLGSWNKSRRLSFSPDVMDSVCYIPFAMRWLCPSTGFSEGPGFPLQRESGWLPRTGKRPPVPVTEGRVQFLFLTSDRDLPLFHMVVLSNGGPRMKLHTNMFKRVNTKLSDWEFKLDGNRRISIMLLALVNLLEVAWYQGWVSLLDEIDESIKVQAVDILNEDATEKLLFYGSVSQSKVYFQLLQLLRIMPLWMRETRVGLEELRSITDNIRTIHIPNPMWDEIFERFTALEEELLSRVKTKTEEIRGLRDGVINTNALLEASKSTSMNRYVIIFTVLTIFYLPLGFVTAVFSMDLLHEEELTGIKSQYATTMVVVSVVTYAVAMGLVMIVDRQRIKPLLTGLLAHFHLLGRQLRHPFGKEDSTAGPAAETDDGREGRGATSGRWAAALWASSGLHLRQRRKRDKGKAALEIPELGIALDAVDDATSFITPSSRAAEEGRAASEVHLPTRSNTVSSHTQSSTADSSADRFEGSREAGQSRSEAGPGTNRSGT